MLNNTRPNDKRKRILAAAGVLLVIFLTYDYFHPVGGGGPTPAVTTPSGLKYIDVKVGTGPSPKLGQEVSVHYVGTLMNGTKFDSSRDHGMPFSFVIGRGNVVKGWDEGVMTMKVGGERKLIVPSELGYGEKGSPDGAIPPDATLNFDVELIGVK